jgi:hypothetical protein
MRSNVILRPFDMLRINSAEESRLASLTRSMTPGRFENYDTAVAINMTQARR